MDKKYRDIQYFKFCLYGFLKNLKFFEVFFLLFFREAGISYLQIGLLYSARQITINLLEIPSGIIADILGRKNALIFGFIAYIASFVIFFLSETFSFFLVAIIAFGVGEAFRSGTHKAMILDYLNKKNYKEIKTQYYGGTRSWSQFGSAISSLIAMSIVLYSSEYRHLFLFASIPYLLDLINLLSYPNYLNGSDLSSKTEPWSDAIMENIKDTWNGLKGIFHSGKTIRAMFSAASYIAVFKFAKDYLQPVLQTAALSIPLMIDYEESQRTAVSIGVTYFSIFLITTWASRNSWKVEAKFKDLPKAINFSYLAGIGAVGICGVFLYFNQQVLAAIFFVGLYFFQNIRRPLIVSYLSDLIDYRVLASGLSAESQIQTILVVICAPLLGWITDSFGLSFGLMITGFLFILIFPLLLIKNSKLD